MTPDEAKIRPVLTPDQIRDLVHTRRLKENIDYVVTVDGECYKQERNVPNPSRELVPSWDCDGVLHVTIPVTTKEGTVLQDLVLQDLVFFNFPHLASKNDVTTKKLDVTKSVTPRVDLVKNDVTGGVTTQNVTPSKKSKAVTGANNPKVLGYYVICGTRYESARAAAKALDTNVNNILRKVTAKHPDYQFFPEN